MRMKKLLSVLLVVAMLASMAVTAFAETTPVSGLGENDIVVAAVTAENVTVTSDLSADTQFTAGAEGSGCTVTVKNANETDVLTGAKLKANVTGGTATIMSGGKNIAAQDTYAEITDVVANGGTQPVTIDSMTFSAAGTYKITFEVVDSQGVSLGTTSEVEITVKEAGSALEEIKAADVRVGGSSATLEGDTIKFASDNFIKGNGVRVEITFNKQVTTDCICKIGEVEKSCKLNNGVLDGLVIPVSDNTEKILTITPDGYKPVTLKLDFSEIHFQEGTITAAIGNFETNKQEYYATLKLTSTFKDPQNVQVVKSTVSGPTEGVASVYPNPIPITVKADQTKSIYGPGTGVEPGTARVTVMFRQPGDSSHWGGTIVTPAAGTYTVRLEFDNGVSPVEKQFTVDANGNIVANPSSGSSGGSLWDDDEDTGTSASAPSANVDSKGAVNTAKANSDAKKAVNKAKNGKANVDVTNAKTVDYAALNAMAKTAAKEDVALTMTAKTTDRNGNVVATLKFDTAEAAKAVAAAGNKEIKLGVETNTKNTKSVTSLFKKWFSNKNITTFKLAQKGEFGFDVEAAVKVDLKKYNKDTLHFYSYNAAANTYKEITNAKATVDAKGFVHFTTNAGNYIIITDEAIASK